MRQIDPGITNQAGNSQGIPNIPLKPTSGPVPRSPGMPVLEVSPWWDPTLAVEGHSPLEQYAEVYWLPVLGPAALLALRYCARGFKVHPGGFSVDYPDFARSLGLGNRRGANAPAVRCLDRLAYFGHARVDNPSAGATLINVRTHVPDLPSHLWRRLPKDMHP